MAHNSRSKPGTWANLDVPTAAQIEAIEVNAVKAVNGDDGGVWAPSATVEIGGAGLKARHVYGLIVVGPNVDTTFTISSTRLIYLDNTISGDRTYSLAATDALAGDVIEIVALPSMSAARVVTINDNVGAKLIDIGSGGFTEARSAKFVYLGAQWRILNANYRRNQIVTTNNRGAGSAFSTTATTPVDVTGLSLTVNAVPNDQILYTATLPVRISAGLGTAQLVITDGAGGQTIGMLFTTTEAHPSCLAYSAKYQVVTGGPIVFRWQINSDSGANTASVPDNGTILVTVTRP